MIASVRGEVVVRRPDHVVIEAAGVGYRLAVSAQTMRSVPRVGEQAMLHTHLVMRDDGMQLYGFASEDERELFHMLNAVQGVGPKVALAVLSGGTTRELMNALASGDAARVEAAEASPVTDNATSLRVDGNNVDVDAEMARLAETQLLHGAVSGLLRERIAMLRYAINEGRR